MFTLHFHAASVSCENCGEAGATHALHSCRLLVVHAPWNDTASSKSSSDQRTLVVTGNHDGPFSLADLMYGVSDVESLVTAPCTCLHRLQENKNTAIPSCTIRIAPGPPETMITFPPSPVLSDCDSLDDIDDLDAYLDAKGQLSHFPTPPAPKKTEPIVQEIEIDAGEDDEELDRTRSPSPLGNGY